MSREADIDHLYELLDRLEGRVGGARTLDECDGYMDWPDRGIYIFFSPTEERASTDQARITRVGTHAVSTGSGTSLWSRLRAHRGTLSGTYQHGGNHRGSVFRERIGEAMIERNDHDEEFPDWAVGSSAGSDIRQQEYPHEQRVSEYIRDLPFLWVNIDDEPGPNSRRAYLERNLIALLSNLATDPIDPRDPVWLGKDSRSEEIQESGLWNVNHVTEAYDRDFLETLENYIEDTAPL